SRLSLCRRLQPAPKSSEAIKSRAGSLAALRRKSETNKFGNRVNTAKGVYLRIAATLAHQQTVGLLKRDAVLNAPLQPRSPAPDRSPSGSRPPGPDIQRSSHRSYIPAGLDSRRS